MKYFIDTEFIEGFHKPLLGKRRHFIDLISIGIVAEDGRNYYAISDEYNPKDASKWVKENVIEPIWWDAARYHGGTDEFKADYIKSNKKIAEEIKEFCKPRRTFEIQKPITIKYSEIQSPEFYGYYSDYDWVLFCSLFGTMMDLPEGFPKYCIDLKQMLDEKVIAESKKDSFIFMANSDEPILDAIKARKDYPKQTNEHCALDDAKWNFELYKFLNKL